MIMNASWNRRTRPSKVWSRNAKHYLKLRKVRYYPRYVILLLIIAYYCDLLYYVFDRDLDQFRNFLWHIYVLKSNSNLSVCCDLVDKYFWFDCLSVWTCRYNVVSDPFLNQKTLNLLQCYANTIQNEKSIPQISSTSYVEVRHDILIIITSDFRNSSIFG